MYLDDSFWCLQGSLARRNIILSFIIYTMSALGLEISIAKGERGVSVTWTGIEFRILATRPLPDGVVGDGGRMGRQGDVFLA